jgi:hypothetical protein
MFRAGPWACRVPLEFFFVFDGKPQDSRKLFSLGRFPEPGKIKECDWMYAPPPLEPASAF